MSDSEKPRASALRNLKGPRGVLMVVGGVVVSWLGYVVIASTIAESRLRTVTSSMNSSLEYVRARSWLPGQLVFHDLIVAHSLRGNQCRTSVERLDLPHNPLLLVLGNLRVSTLTADGVRTECGFGETRQAVAQSESPILAAGMTTLSGGNDVWTTDTSSADRSIEIERAVVHVEALSIGNAASVKPFEFRASGFAVTRGTVSLDHGEAKLLPGTLTYEEQALLGSLSLSLRVRSAESPMGAHGGLDVQASAGTFLTLYASPFTWNHKGGAFTQFAEPLLVSAEVLASSVDRLRSVQWRASTPSMRYLDEPATSVTMSDVVASVRYETEAMLPDARPPEVSLHAASMSARRDAQVLTTETVTIDGSLRNGAGPGQSQLFESAVLEVAGARLVRDQFPAAQQSDDRFSAEVHIKATQATRGYAGKVHMRGNDAGIFLTLMNSAQLPSWVSSKFDDEPFSLRAALELQRGTVRVRDLNLERGALTLSGSWQFGPERSGGALLMEYGGVHVGIDSTQTGELVIHTSYN